ncbi:CvpA family protein [Planctomycetota bacterium]
MLFWTGILASGLFTWLAIKIGFYETLVMLFNIIISIYISFFLTPAIIDFIPAANDNLPCNPLALAIMAIATFLILFGITYTFLTGQFKITFPKIFEILFAGLMGFLAGFLVFSFATFLITITPISQNRLVSQIGFNRQSQQVNISYICWWCDLVNMIVATPDEKISTEYIISELFEYADMEEADKELENNESNELDEPNNILENIIEENESPPS